MIAVNHFCPVALMFECELPLVAGVMADFSFVPTASVGPECFGNSEKEMTSKDKRGKCSEQRCEDCMCFRHMDCISCDPILLGI